MKVTSGTIYTTNEIFSSNKSEKSISVQPQSIFGKAADVSITSQGKMLAQAVAKTENIGEATSELSELNKKDSERAAQKARISEIDEQLATDDTLTDDDKNVLLKEKAQLEESSKDFDDKLHELYAQKRDYQKQIDSGILTMGEGLEKISYYDSEIAAVRKEIHADAVHRVDLQIESNQEKSDVYTAKIKEQVTASDTVQKTDSDDENIILQTKISKDILSISNSNKKRDEQNV